MTGQQLTARRGGCLDLVGCAFPTETMVWELGTGQRQLVEVAKALRREARVLILDEPTASLSQGESARLFDLIRELKRKRVGIVYVSHRLEEIAGLVDRVTVLRDGRSMGTFPAADIDRRKIVSLITGHDAFPTRSRQLCETGRNAIAGDKAALSQTESLRMSRSTFAEARSSSSPD